MAKLDMSHFKKVSEDGQCAVLRHPDGHEVKVAKKGLKNDALRIQLAKLPLHKADGGDTPNPQPNQSPAPSDDSQNIPLPNGGLQGQALKDYVAANPGPQATTGVNPNNMTPDQAAAAQQPDQSQQAQAPDESDDNAPEAPAPQPTPTQQAANPPPPATPQQAFQNNKATINQELTQEQYYHMQDLASGAITSENYHSLFAKKDTLGKIGSIFGMIMSGAGAGLSHQPNAMLEMMNQQIGRELEAQKDTKANAQNFLRLNQQHQMLQAQMKGMDVNNDATKIETATKSYALAQAQMMQTSYHSLVQTVDKMPPGPQKNAAQQQLGMVYNQIGAKIANVNDQASGAAAYYNTLFGGNTGAEQTPEQQFQKQTMGMKMLGPQGEARAKDLESKHVPGFTGNASAPMSEGEKKDLTNLVDYDAQLQRTMQFAQNHANSGPWDVTTKNQGQVLAANLQGAYRQATHGGVYKAGEQDFIEKIIPQDPTAFFTNTRVLSRLQTLHGENQANLQQYAKDKGFQGYAGVQQQGWTPQGQQQPNQVQGTPEERVTKNGRTALYDSQTKQFLRWK